MLAALTRYLLPTAGAVGLLLVGMLYVQTQRLESAQRQLVEVREDIIRMPEDVRKAPLPEIWRRAFRAADEIGGVQ